MGYGDRLTESEMEGAIYNDLGNYSMLSMHCEMMNTRAFVNILIRLKLGQKWRNFRSVKNI